MQRLPAMFRQPCSLKTQGSRTGRSRLVDSRGDPLGDDVGHQKMYVRRTGDLKIVKLTALGPGITRFETLFIALSVIPVERAGGQGQCQDARMRMPSSVPPGGKGAVLEKNRRCPLGPQRSPELAIVGREIPTSLDVTIVIPRGQDRECKVKDRRRPSEAPDDTADRHNTNNYFAVNFHVLSLSCFDRMTYRVTGALRSTRKWPERMLFDLDRQRLRRTNRHALGTKIAL